MILTEIQFYYSQNPDTKVVLNGTNIISFGRSSEYSTYPTPGYDSAVLNDNTANYYTGSTSSAIFQSYIVELPAEEQVVAIHLMGQDSYANRPTEVRLYCGLAQDSWSLYKTWTGSPLAIGNGLDGGKFNV